MKVALRGALAICGLLVSTGLFALPTKVVEWGRIPLPSATISGAAILQYTDFAKGLAYISDGAIHLLSSTGQGWSEQELHGAENYAKASWLSLDSYSPFPKYEVLIAKLALSDGRQTLKVIRLDADGSFRLYSESLDDESASGEITDWGIATSQIWNAFCLVRKGGNTYFNWVNMHPEAFSMRREQPLSLVLADGEILDGVSALVSSDNAARLVAITHRDSKWSAYGVDFSLNSGLRIQTLLGASTQALSIGFGVSNSSTYLKFQTPESSYITKQESNGIWSTIGPFAGGDGVVLPIAIDLSRFLAFLSDPTKSVTLAIIGSTPPASIATVTDAESVPEFGYDLWWASDGTIMAAMNTIAKSQGVGEAGYSTWYGPVAAPEAFSGNSCPLSGLFPDQGSAWEARAFSSPFSRAILIRETSSGVIGRLVWNPSSMTYTFKSLGELSLSSSLEECAAVLCEDGILYRSSLAGEALAIIQGLGSFPYIGSFVNSYGMRSDLIVKDGSDIVVYRFDPSRG